MSATVHEATSQVDHLVVGEGSQVTSSEKYVKAKQWKIPTSSYKWIEKCWEMRHESTFSQSYNPRLFCVLWDSISVTGLESQTRCMVEND